MLQFITIITINYPSAYYKQFSGKFEHRERGREREEGGGGGGGGGGGRASLPPAAPPTTRRILEPAIRAKGVIALYNTLLSADRGDNCTLVKEQKEEE